MEATSPVTMDRDSIDAFLGSGGTCVLALASDSKPYAVPVSYAYEPDRTTFYLRLGDTGTSEKRAFLGGETPARLVAYDVDDRASRSVIAEGPLEEIESGDLTPELVEVLSEGEFPYFELWDESKRDIEFTLARLRPSTLTGRRTPGDD